MNRKSVPTTYPVTQPTSKPRPPLAPTRSTNHLVAMEVVTYILAGCFLLGSGMMFSMFYWDAYELEQAQVQAVLDAKAAIKGKVSLNRYQFNLTEDYPIILTDTPINASTLGIQTDYSIMTAVKSWQFLCGYMMIGVGCVLLVAGFFMHHFRVISA